MPTGTMLLKHVWGTTVKDDGGSVKLNDEVTILGSNEFVQKVTVPAGTTVEIDCGSIDKTKITSVFISADQAETVDTNALGGSGGQTIPLAANKAWGWHNQMPTPTPVEANITKIFATNDQVKDATFRVAILSDLRS